jgi:hypothetical protein
VRGWTEEEAGAREVDIGVEEENNNANAEHPPPGEGGDLQFYFG